MLGRLFVWRQRSAKTSSCTGNRVMTGGGTAGHGTRRFVTCTVSVAAARSRVVFDTLRASTRTVLLLQAVASSSKNRLLVASEACAGSPTRAPVTVTSSSAVAHAAKVDRSQAASRELASAGAGQHAPQQRRAVQHGGRLRQAIEPQRLQVDRPVGADHADPHTPQAAATGSARLLVTK
jgi:hypothetical protein